MSVESRIWKATRVLLSQRIPIDGFKVVMHPATLAHLKREVNPFLAGIHEIASVGGLPIEIDRSVGKDRIVLRFEVEA